ncbi:Hypothetical predicted protein [Pelobates cultripes]|uniref:Uncharacterized protein n=1 Tax=Pelobates cultripes TaxID=61616 RepID=A0AAD1SXM4_PELCU|nr:Hypothetical predicted protein [Pelobates cultripes]
MVIVIEEVGRELIQVKKSIQDFELTHVTALQSLPSTEFMLKLQDDIQKYQNNLIRFKKVKVEKVNHDYKYHQVYRWLRGSDSNMRYPIPRFRTRIRKPLLQTVDISSGESASDGDIRDDQHARKQVTFLKEGEHPNDPPRMTSTTVQDIRDTRDILGADKRVTRTPHPKNPTKSLIQKKDFL